VRRYLLVGVLSLFICGAFFLGRFTGGHRAVVDSRDDAQADLRQDVAEMKASLAGIQRAVAGLGMRLASSPPGGASTTTSAPPVCPPAVVAHDDDSDPESAAHVARARGDQHFRQGESLVAAAMARGTWTSKEIEAFRSLHREAPGPEWIFLMQQIDAAINAGTLHPDPELQIWH